VILLSDGKVDVAGDRMADREATAGLRREVIPRLADNGVGVHTVALSEKADTDLLADIADRTRGLAISVRSSAELQRAFLALFKATAPRTGLPLVDNRVQVDESVPDDASRAAWVDRSLQLLEPLAAAWLDAERQGPEEVMRRLLIIRQEDLHQCLAEVALSTRKIDEGSDRLRRNERERSKSIHEPAANAPDERRSPVKGNEPDTNTPDLVDRDRPT
jgi:hypothetical protein